MSPARPAQPSPRAPARTIAFRALGIGATAYLLLLGLLNSLLVSRPLTAKVRSALSARLQTVQLGNDFSVSPLGNLRLGPLKIGPLEQPTVRVETLVLRPRFGSLLFGRVELEKVMLRDVHVDVGIRGEKLESLWDELQGRPTGSSENSDTTERAPLPEVHFRTLILEGNWGRGEPDHRLTVGPIDGRVRAERGPRQRRVDVMLLPPGGGGLRWEITQAPQRWLARAVAEELTPEVLPKRFRAALPVQVVDGSLSGSVVVDWPQGQTVTGQLQWKLQRLTVQGDRLASQPVGPMDLQGEALFQGQPEAGRLTLEKGRLSVGNTGKVELAVEGEVVSRESPRVALTVRAPAIDYPSLLSSLPSALRPGNDVPALPGSFGFELRLTGPGWVPALWTLDASLNLDGLRHGAKEQALFLNKPFTHKFVDKDGKVRDVRIGGDNPFYAPLSELPEYVVRAVTVSEDAGFFGHAGFDFSELKNAFAEGAEAGRIVRGGSTISQQLAKNLFLSREKTVARKVQEAVATLSLEAGVSKRRLLEIYLNLIEWGPNIHGIGEASEHYFGKKPSALSIKEAVFLATIIPNPVRYHVYFTRKSLTETWEKRVEELLTKLRNLGIITEEEFEQARTDSLQFAPG